MRRAHPDVLKSGRERLRTGAWRGHGHIAYLSPLPDAPLPSVAFVRQCLDQLAERGFSRVVTTALSLQEQAGFLGAGFGVEEDLHLLVHDLRWLPPAPPAPIRRATRRHRAGALEVDAGAFPPFWRIDDQGLTDALAATPQARFRIATAGAGVTAYAVSGRAGRRGFLQRLAVGPHHQRQGLGRALALDGLHWLRRWRVEQVVVNTQLGNTAALSLYESLGFHREPTCLSVLSRRLCP